MFAIKTLHANDGVHTSGSLAKRNISTKKVSVGRDANVEAELTATHYRRSPLFQGGLRDQNNNAG